MYQHEGKKFLWSTVLGELLYFRGLYLQVLMMKIQERCPYCSDRMRGVVIVKYTKNLLHNKGEPSLVGGSWIHLSIQPLLPFWSNLRATMGEDIVNKDQGFNRSEMLKLGKGVGGKAEKSSTTVETFLKTTDCKTQAY